MFIVQVVIIGILLVFLILVILTLILALFPRIINEKKTENIQNIKKAEEPKQTVTVPANSDKPTDDYALISVITAAIAAYRAESGESSDLSSFKVVAFRKTKLRRKV